MLGILTQSQGSRGVMILIGTVLVDCILKSRVKPSHLKTTSLSTIQQSEVDRPRRTLNRQAPATGPLPSAHGV